MRKWVHSYVRYIADDVTIAVTASRTVGATSR
jgi:hypothetical protein